MMPKKRRRKRATVFKGGCPELIDILNGKQSVVEKMKKIIEVLNQVKRERPQNLGILHVKKSGEMSKTLFDVLIEFAVRAEKECEGCCYQGLIDSLFDGDGLDAGITLGFCDDRLHEEYKAACSSKSKGGQAYARPPLASGHYALCDLNGMTLLEYAFRWNEPGLVGALLTKEVFRLELASKAPSHWYALPHMGFAYNNSGSYTQYERLNGLLQSHGVACPTGDFHQFVQDQRYEDLQARHLQAGEVDSSTQTYSSPNHLDFTAQLVSLSMQVQGLSAENAALRVGLEVVSTSGEDKAADGGKKGVAAKEKGVAARKKGVEVKEEGAASVAVEPEGGRFSPVSSAVLGGGQSDGGGASSGGASEQKKSAFQLNANAKVYRPPA
jgi:hypothetical protein